MRHMRLDGQWLEFIGGLLATPLMALPADRIALQLTKSFGLVGASYELGVPGRAPQRQLWPLEERFGGHRAEIEQRPRRTTARRPWVPSRWSPRTVDGQLRFPSLRAEDARRHTAFEIPLTVWIRRGVLHSPGCRIWRPAGGS
jgi:hypothetical protein